MFISFKLNNRSIHYNTIFINTKLKVLSSNLGTDVVYKAVTEKKCRIGSPDIFFKYRYCNFIVNKLYSVFTTKVFLLLNMSWEEGPNPRTLPAITVLVVYV
uniref:Uncharacterized protein n=1 Tax=Schizaphis graminum TaxID=13262 RepID=A0A2S2P3Y0_SCHGA